MKKIEKYFGYAFWFIVGFLCCGILFSTFALPNYRNEISKANLKYETQLNQTIFWQETAINDTLEDMQVIRSITKACSYVIQDLQENCSISNATRQKVQEAMG